MSIASRHGHPSKGVCRHAILGGVHSRRPSDLVHRLRNLTDAQGDNRPNLDLVNEGKGDVMIQASQSVIAFAGGAWDASLNFYSTGGNCLVVTQQVDEWVFVVGQDDFNVGRYTVAEWIGDVEQTDPPLIACDDERMAWELLRLIREDCLLWQCGACDAWIFTSNRPRIGLLRCSTCGDGGVDFRHADRHVGGQVDE